MSKISLPTNISKFFPYVSTFQSIIYFELTCVHDTRHESKFSLSLFLHQFSSVVQLWPLFATPWIAALQASLSITNSRSLLKLMSIEWVMPSSHLILCRPLLLLPQSLPASGSFLMSQLFAWGGQSIGVSASASVLPVNTQDWSPLGWTGCIWMSNCSGIVCWKDCLLSS